MPGLLRGKEGCWRRRNLWRISGWKRRRALRGPRKLPIEPDGDIRRVCHRLAVHCRNLRAQDERELRALCLHLAARHAWLCHQLRDEQ